LASGVYRLANKCGWPTLLALRLFSLLLGGLSIMVGYAVLRAILPARREIALGATALAAFLPMHLATLSAVNNDALVELLIALVAWGVLRPGPIADRWRIERTGAIALALGRAELTKMQSYPAFAVAFGALIWDTWHAPTARPCPGARRSAAAPCCWASPRWSLSLAVAQYVDLRLGDPLACADMTPWWPDNSPQPSTWQRTAGWRCCAPLP
jgi:MFS family permease